MVAVFLEKRILLVDDENLSSSAIMDLLKVDGITTRLAVDGEAGVELAKSFKPHLILMDCHMPVLDGPSAARQIRKIPEFAETPIIAISATVPAELEAWSQDPAFTSFLRKPVQASLLYSLLRKYLVDQ